MTVEGSCAGRHGACRRARSPAGRELPSAPARGEDVDSRPDIRGSCQRRERRPRRPRRMHRRAAGREETEEPAARRGSTGADREGGGGGAPARGRRWPARGEDEARSKRDRGETAVLLARRQVGRKLRFRQPARARRRGQVRGSCERSERTENGHSRKATTGKGRASGRAGEGPAGAALAERLARSREREACPGAACGGRRGRRDGSGVDGFGRRWPRRSRGAGRGGRGRSDDDRAARTWRSAARPSPRSVNGARTRGAKGVTRVRSVHEERAARTAQCTFLASSIGKYPVRNSAGAHKQADKDRGEPR